MDRRKLARGTLVLALVLLAALFSFSLAAASGGKKLDLLLVAVDGADPGVVSSMIGKGELPNFRRLIDGGSIGSFTYRDEDVTLSPVIWTTVATGFPPEEHGIVDFAVDGKLLTSADRKVPAFWNVLAKAGLRSASVGWLMSWPAEGNSGIIVSDRATWGTFEDKVSPRDVLEVDKIKSDSVRCIFRDFPKALKRFTSFPYDPHFTKKYEEGTSDYTLNYLVFERLLKIYCHDTQIYRAALGLASDKGLDLMAVYFRGIDYVSHGFWKFFEPEAFRPEGLEPPKEEVEHLRNVIPEYYRYMDEVLGELLRLAADEDTLVIVMSDHGFGPALGKYVAAEEKHKILSGNHRPNGFFIISGSKVVKDYQQSQQVYYSDIAPTIYYYFDLPLNRYMAGRPLVHYFTEEFASQRSLRYYSKKVSDIAPASEKSSDETRTKEDEEIIKTLKSLGYLQ